MATSLTPPDICVGTGNVTVHTLVVGNSDIVGTGGDKTHPETVVEHSAVESFAGGCLKAVPAWQH